MTQVRDRYFDHDADMGIIGVGATVTEAFADAAYSMFTIMAELKDLKADQHIQVTFQEEDLEFALVKWLNMLLVAAKEANTVPCRFALHKAGDVWQGEAWGEAWQVHIESGVEVKGPTLTMLSVKKTNQSWEARCIVDV